MAEERATELEEQLWRRAEVYVGNPIPLSTRDFLTREGRVGAYRAAGSDGERDRIIAGVVATVRNLHLSGVATTGQGERLRPSNLDDPRWQLLSELEEVYARAGDDPGVVEPRWHPLEVMRVMPEQAYPFPAGQVLVRFDGRISLALVVAALRDLWPTLRERGWVHNTRPIEAQNLALLHAVCLEMPPGLTWDERLSRWNDAHPERLFGDAREFQTNFRRIEESLTGKRGGLAWFYDEREFQGSYLMDNLAGDREPRSLLAALRQLRFFNGRNERENM